MNSTRNLFVFGISIMLGSMIPSWLEQNPAAINTGVYYRLSPASTQTYPVWSTSCLASISRHYFTVQHRDRWIHFDEVKFIDGIRSITSSTTAVELLLLLMLLM